MEDLEAARRRWLNDRPQYVEFGKVLKARLESVVRPLGLPGAEISVRTKEMDSLLKKLVFKQNHHTYDSLGDKLGARIIVKRTGHVELVCAVIAERFVCGEFDDKAESLQEHEVGYLGTHVDIALREDDPEASRFPADQWAAELQLRTLAQHLWSEMSHDTAYKGGSVIRRPLRRRLYGLAGVIEFIDNEFERLDVEISNLPDMPELKVLKALERHYFQLTAQPGNPDLSLQILRLLYPLYQQTPEEVSARLDDFLTEKREFLREKYRLAEETRDQGSAFMFQPEALLIYDQLTRMEYAIRKKWVEELPPEELERIAVTFGFSFD